MQRELEATEELLEQKETSARAIARWVLIVRTKPD